MYVYSVYSLIVLCKDVCLLSCHMPMSIRKVMNQNMGEITAPVPISSHCVLSSLTRLFSGLLSC